MVPHICSLSGTVHSMTLFCCMRDRAWRSRQRYRTGGRGDPHQCKDAVSMFFQGPGLIVRLLLKEAECLMSWGFNLEKWQDEHYNRMKTQHSSVKESGIFFPSSFLQMETSLGSQTNRIPLKALSKLLCQ